MFKAKRVSAIVLSGILACSALSGCSGPIGTAAPTPTPVPTDAAALAGYVAAALSCVTSMEYDTETYMKAAMSLSGLFGDEEDSEALSAEMSVKVDMTAQATSDPEMAHAKGTVEVNVFDEKNTQEVETYTAKEDGKYVIYSNAGDGVWSLTETGDAEMDDMFNRSMFEAVSDGRIRADLAAETVKINDIDAYRLDIELTGDEIMEYVGNTFDNMNSVFGDEYAGIMDEADLLITLYIEPDTNLPIRMEFDGTEIGNQIMSYVQSYIEVTVSEFTVSADYKSFNEVAAITIPEDVTANAVPAGEENNAADTYEKDEGIFDEEMSESGLSDTEFTIPEADEDGKYRIYSDTAGIAAACVIPDGQTVNQGERSALFTLGTGTDLPSTQYIFCFIDNMTSEEVEEIARQTEWVGDVDDADVGESRVDDTKVINVNGHEICYVLKSGVLYAGTEEQSYSAEVNAWTQLDGTIFVISYDYYDEVSSASDGGTDYEALVRAAFENVTFE